MKSGGAVNTKLDAKLWQKIKERASPKDGGMKFVKNSPHSSRRRRRTPKNGRQLWRQMPKMGG